MSEISRRISRMFGNMAMEHACKILFINYFKKRIRFLPF